MMLLLPTVLSMSVVSNYSRQTLTAKPAARAQQGRFLNKADDVIEAIVDASGTLNKAGFKQIAPEADEATMKALDCAMGKGAPAAFVLYNVAKGTQTKEYCGWWNLWWRNYFTWWNPLSWVEAILMLPMHWLSSIVSWPASYLSSIVFLFIGTGSKWVPEVGCYNVDRPIPGCADGFEVVETNLAWFDNAWSTAKCCPISEERRRCYATSTPCKACADGYIRREVQFHNKKSRWASVYSFLLMILLDAAPNPHTTYNLCCPAKQCFEFQNANVCGGFDDSSNLHITETYDEPTYSRADLAMEPYDQTKSIQQLDSGAQSRAYFDVRQPYEPQLYLRYEPKMAGMCCPKPDDGSPARPVDAIWPGWQETGSSHHPFDSTPEKSSMVMNQLCPSEAERCPMKKDTWGDFHVYYTKEVEITLPGDVFDGQKLFVVTGDGRLVEFRAPKGALPGAPFSVFPEPPDWLPKDPASPSKVLRSSSKKGMGSMAVLPFLLIVGVALLNRLKKAGQAAILL